MKSFVVDFHVHHTSYQAITESALEFAASAFSSQEEYLSFSEKYSRHDSFVQLMDQNGVDYSIILSEYAPLTTGICTNEAVEAFCQDNPRLIPFCSLNPYLHPEMSKTLEDLCINHGFKGLKLYPTYNYFYPNDSFMYPLYAAAQRLGIPVLFHTGSSVFANSRIKYGNPLFFDDVAVDFPDLKIIMAHGGRGPWYNEALAMVRLHRNIYIDISGLPPKNLLENFPDMPRFAHKFIFGSDWPSVVPQKNIEIIRTLNMSQEAISKILGENAAKLLGLV